LRSESIEFVATPELGNVSAILDRPESAHSLLVLGHGSGSTMRVPFIDGLSAALTAGGVATFRFEYPYSEREDFVPYTDMPMDTPDVLVATIRAAVEAAANLEPDLPLFAGGHSVSGRLTSVTDSESPIPHVRGVIMLGFPLKGAMENAAHFAAGTAPLLFVQGTADALGDADQIQHVADSIGARATLRTVDSASHGFAVPARPDDDVYSELAEYISLWTMNVM
jgi:predicted alpha/beta-hydrolase family hydrolase